MGYLLSLLGAASFFICFNGYFSFYILVLALVFPLFSLVVSLPGMLGAGVCLALDRKTIRRGETATISLTLTSRHKLPVGRLSARFRCENLMTGDLLAFRKAGSGGALGLTLEDGVESRHCGLIQCQVLRVRVCDMLGLFTHRLPTPPAVSMLSLPLDLPPEPVPTLLGEGGNTPMLKPRPGGGPGEDYDLRPYRAGDPLRAVHWKLSSKLDGLIVRETLEPTQITVILSYDHRGRPEDLDLVLDRLDAVSRALIERERPHIIRWADPVSGMVHSHTISGQKDLRTFQYAAFATPATLIGNPLPFPRSEGALVRHLHIVPADDPDAEGGVAL